MRALPPSLLLLAAAGAAAQDSAPDVRVDPRDGIAYHFVLDRRTTVRSSPGVTYETPLERQVVSYLRVEGAPAEDTSRVILRLTYQRVHGFEKGGLLTEDVTFDRRRDDPPGARPETLLVGRTVEVEVRRDGSVAAIRGLEEALGGSSAAILGALGDLHAFVPPLPPRGAGTAADGWETVSMEGRALLRTRVTARHGVRTPTADELTVVSEGDVAAAPEGAGPEFERSFRVRRGRRAASVRVARADGLPLETRHLTDYAVDALLTGSEMRVGVDAETVVTIRRIATPEDAGAAPPAEPRAPTPGGDTPNTGLPGWLGASRDVIERLAGEPSTSGTGVLGGTFQTYGRLGLVYEYDDDGFVRRLTATQIRDGASFQGKVLGVALGDHVDGATRLWGEPTLRRTRPGSAYEDLTWVFDSLQIEVEVWIADGSDPAFGEVRAGRVKRIRVTARAAR